MGKQEPSSQIEVSIDSGCREKFSDQFFTENPTAGDGDGDYRPFRRWFPWLVPVFVIANIVMFAVTMYVNDCPKNTGSCVLPFLGRFSFESLKMNPMLGPSATTLNKMGAMLVSGVMDQRQVWRLITCIWLHAGVVHVLSNMLSLLFIGIRLEQEFGFVRIGLLYVLSGLGGSLMSALFIQSSISVGASGALFGLLGSMLSELITNWTIYSNKLTTLLILLIIIAINLAIGILPHVDNFAHIGGFFSGFLLGFVFLIRPQFRWLTRNSAPLGLDNVSVKHKHKAYQYVLCIISAILLVAGFTAGLTMLFQGVDANKYCSWCHYLSCVPTSKWSCNAEASCMTYEIGKQINLRCMQNGKTRVYTLRDATLDKISVLCSQLCSL